MMAAPTCMLEVVRHSIPGVGAPERRWQHTPLRMVRLFRRPKVPSPSRIRQHKEKRDGGRYENEHVDVRRQSF
jgi:hypothetical protein